MDIAPAVDTLTEDERLDALCAQTDPEVFFATKGDSASTLAAKRVCAKCPLTRVEDGGTGRCLEVALANGELGVWAGTSEKQRRKMRRLQREAVAA